MAAIVTLLVMVTVSMLITRIGAIALTLTGLSQGVARFQARSAFTGVGFTTGESEKLVNHPVRRRILMMLMFWGNLGIAAVIAGTIASFTTATADTKEMEFWEAALLWAHKLSVLLGGITILWLFFTSQFIDRLISRLVERALKKFTKLDVRDFTSLLHLHDGYVVMDLNIKPDDWIDGKSLAEARLSSEGVLVLGLTRDNGNYVGSPNGQTRIQSGDLLTLYGPGSRLEELDIRKRGYFGDRAHKIAVELQKQAADKSDQDQEPQPDPDEAAER